MQTEKKDRETRIRYDIFTKNIIKIIKQLIFTIIVVYVIGCIWFRLSDSRLLTVNEDEPTFVVSFYLNEKTPGENLIICVYFILTTLTTVGFGDYFPISIVEKIVGSIIMFCGVTFFSLLMA